MKRLALALLGATSIVLTSSFLSTTRAPLGPGGVLDSVVEFVAAMDRGDTKAMQAQLQDVHHGILFRPDEESGYAIGREEEHGPMFFDAGFDADWIRAEESNSFVKLLEQEHGKLTSSGWEITTRVLSLEASCSSRDFSYAIGELERVYEKPGEEARVVSVRLTALLRYGDSGFRIWHWHASTNRSAR